MSKDIRSYFKSNGFDSKGSSNPKTEVDSQNKKRNHRVIESDDENDDDAFQSKKKAKEPPTAAKEKKKTEVIVQVENFFGNAPVNQIKQKIVSKNSEENKQTQSVKKPRGRPKKKEKEKRNSSEVAFESDPELEASILQADAEDLVLAEKKNNGIASNGKEAEVVDEKGKSPKKEVKDKKSTPKKDTEDKKKTPKKEVTLDIKPNKTPKQEKAEADNSLLSSEQKRRNAEAYQKYLNRSGPKNPGSKTIPQGTPTCLQGLAFVITGVLDSLEREEATELIKKCGGRVTSAVSKKTDYMVVGEEPGVSKIQKAESFGTKKIDEDGLLELIRKSAEAESEKDSFIESTPEKASRSSQKKAPRKRVASVEETKCHPTPAKKAREASKKTEKNTDQVEHAAESKGAHAHVKPLEIEKTNLKNFEKTGGDMLWVDKYKPKSTKNIVGQMGEKSSVKKLTRWLQNWHKNHSNKNGKKSARPAAPWAQNDDGCYFKCALLSGPPGVGKTTTIHLVCKELGMDAVEFNASDTRSKRLLQDEVSEILCSKSVRGFLQGSGESFQKHVLVMDEVDGMAGNEDRGGIQELIQLIKDTKIPIVGICNDRNHPKMRSLANYCYDLRFQRPRVEQIKSAMKSVCFKENLDITGEALEELIIASNHDVRQTLHGLSLLASSNKQPTLEEAKKGAEAKKSLNLSPWEVTRRVFSASEQEKMTFTDKTDLFFQDYSRVPLFVQDTYLRVKPYKAKNSEKETLELISKAADSLALGDVVERAIRTQNAWNLLPVQAVFSSVLPGHHMSGHVQGQVQFPIWLGKNTKSIRFDRLLQDLSSLLRITVTGNKQAVNLDYLSHMKNAIVNPLLQEGSLGVQTSVQFMLSYYLTKIDLDTILELTSWPEMKDSFSEVDPKVKAAFSRTLSKEARLAIALKKSPKIKGDEDNFNLEDGEEDTEDTESDTVDSDPMIKVGKPKAKKETSEKRNKEEKKAASKKGKK